MKMVTVEEIHRAQRAYGPATILAIGTATPPNFVYQNLYPDFYFRVTKAEHMTEHKKKFQRMCEKSMIRKRHTHLTEEVLENNPSMCSYKTKSLDARQDILIAEVPKLGKEAAEKAIAEWGQPRSKITHLVFCTSGGVDMPGADYQLVKLLGLNPSINRYMMYQQGCYGGGALLRLAKDLAENNSGARVLAVCSEMNALTFCGPSPTDTDNLVWQVLFGDGAAAVIVGADLIEGVEKAIFQIVSAKQTAIPDSNGALYGHLTEVGIIGHISKDIPRFIYENIETCMENALDSLGIRDWNSVFYAVHPGGPAVLNQVEKKLGLEEDRLKCSRHVLSEYGNMWSGTVLFVLDEVRRSSVKRGLKSTGEGLDWGVLIGIGPGLTIETVVLHSVPII